MGKGSPSFLNNCTTDLIYYVLGGNYYYEKQETNLTHCAEYYNYIDFFPFNCVAFLLENDLHKHKNKYFSRKLKIIHDQFDLNAKAKKAKGL